MSLPAGILDRRITFQSFTATRDADTGEETKSWANIATVPTVWAKVEPLSQKEMVDVSHVLTLNDRAFTIRFRDDITPSMRIVYDSANYDIHSAVEDPKYGRKEALRIVARAVA